VEKLLEGAFDLLETPYPALYLAAAKYLHYQAGRKISVAMPYSSFMTEFTEWYFQLWAESLGKEGKGQTPLKAVGTSSQHAILQLFIDGPDDKFYQLFFVEEYEKDPVLPEDCKILPFLAGKRISQVMEAEFKGTVHALKLKKRPLVIFRLSKLKEYQMGYLFMTYMVATVVMGRLIGVNPYGQPAVEIGKRVAIEELRRSSYEGGMQ
jgi:glucose-6-phosphate isomerase